MGGRYYEASVGRFTQWDPEPGSAYEPLSYNRYVYVAANPVNYTDPTGYQGPWSRLRRIRGVTTPWWTLTYPSGGRVNVYYWGVTGRLSNREAVNSLMIAGGSAGAASLALSRVPHPIARGASIAAAAVGHGLTIASGVFGLTGWGLR